MLNKEKIKEKAAKYADSQSIKPYDECTTAQAKQIIEWSRKDFEAGAVWASEQYEEVIHTLQLLKDAVIGKASVNTIKSYIRNVNQELHKLKQP